MGYQCLLVLQEIALKNKKNIEKRKKILYNEKRKKRKEKNMIKKISIFIIIIALLIILIPKNTYAGLSVPVINTDIYASELEGKTTSSEELTRITDTILGVIYYIGVFLSVGILMAVGIKYMTGSIEEKAQYKETMVPYIVGAVLLFGGINILKIIYDLVLKAL